ncbi:MAG: hypothetical protein WC453_01595 [Patescibacteria group bacterium]
MASEKRKLAIIQTATIALALLILAIWLFNLKNVWQAGRQQASEDNNRDWQNLKTELNQTIVAFKDQLTQLNQNRQAQEAAKGRALINSLLAETKKIAAQTATNTTLVGTSSLLVATSSPDTATSTATTSDSVVTPPPSASSCPAYINCMPTVGPSESPARSCQIPPGCEGITQIAY